MVGAAVSNVMTAVLDPFAGTAPNAPVQSPLSWTMLAAARREIANPAPAPTAAVTPATSIPNAAVTSIAPPAASPAAAAQPVQAPVVRVQTPPLAFLQYIPIIGPTIVTPIVGIIHQIPIISDMLHPLIGYPVQAGLPAGTPIPTDVYLTSFDGTQLNVHFMPATGLKAGQTAPTILAPPGLPAPGATNLYGTPLDGVILDLVGQLSVATLRNAGYNVVTWDPRGEWFSGGQVELQNPAYEGRDTSAIISWVATRPEAQLDNAATLDPRIGMVGVSYGGGAQLAAAVSDKRIDAIVPTIAWNSLNTSLDKSGAPKTSWSLLLYFAQLLTNARQNPQVLNSIITGALTGKISQAQQDFLAGSGPTNLVGNITAPTLLIQGTADTLFTLQETDTNATPLIANGVPTKVLWFCGGHGLCLNNLFDPTDGAVIQQNTLAWLDRYVKEDQSANTGPQFEWVDQQGKWYGSNTYPAAHGQPIVATSKASGVLPLIPVLGEAGIPFSFISTKAINAYNLTTPLSDTTQYVVGAPQVTLTYSGTGANRYVYAQLVDNSTGLVLGSQVTPVPVTLDGQTHTVTVPLEMVAQTVKPGQSLTLQLTADSGVYQDLVPTLGKVLQPGALKVSNLQLTLPTADPAAVTQLLDPASGAA